jgi:hypothetical protein
MFRCSAELLLLGGFVYDFGGCVAVLGSALAADVAAFVHFPFCCSRPAAAATAAAYFLFYLAISSVTLWYLRSLAPHVSCLPLLISSPSTAPPLSTVVSRLLVCGRPGTVVPPQVPLLYMRLALL